MPLSRQSILSFSRVLLGMLVLLLGMKAARQEAQELLPPPHAAVTAAAGHGASYHRLAGRRDTHHPAPGRQKRHRSRAHRAPVAKIAVPAPVTLPAIPVAYRQADVLPLSGVYRYDFFREITPPPPKDC